MLHIITAWRLLAAGIFGPGAMPLTLKETTLDIGTQALVVAALAWLGNGSSATVSFR
jgi:hypothetical protein